MQIQNLQRKNLPLRKQYHVIPLDWLQVGIKACPMLTWIERLHKQNR